MIEFDGPRGRYHRARYELDNPAVPASNDVWVIKLKQMLKQRKSYKSDVSYREAQPLFSALFDVFEDDSITSRKHMLEAMLVTGESFSSIAAQLKDAAFPDGLVVGLYHELFYNIRPYLNNVPQMYRYIVLPLTRCNGVSIPFGAIWKLLAYVGGMDVLKASGFGTRPLNAEDLAYLVQLGGYRNAALMLKYVADGDLFAKDNPVATNIALGLAELSRQVGTPGIDKFGFKQLEDKTVQDFSHALTGLFRMVYEPQEISQEPSSIEQRLITCKPSKIED